MKPIYLDNAAASPIDPKVLKAMTEAAKLAGNPSSFNDAGRQARQAIEKARAEIAQFLNSRPGEIVFTSSGSEANNLAILGSLKDLKKPLVLTTPIEHPSILETLRHNKIKTKLIKVDEFGQIDLKALKQALTPDISLVSIMYANNEIGTILPIKKIAKLILESKEKNNGRPLFHTDACQATGHLDMNVQRLGVDLLTLNSSKINGPRGTGVLYVRKGTALNSLISGGSQEHGLRAGTENTAAIVGLAKSISLVDPKISEKISSLRDYGILELNKNIPGIRLNGSMGGARLANNINISVPGLESEVLLLELDKHGIAAGSGSACTSHAVEPSHVLKAINVPEKYIHGALRFSLGKDTTKKDIDYLVKTLKKIIPTLQKRYTTN